MFPAICPAHGCIVWAGRPSNLKADWSNEQLQLPVFCSVRGATQSDTPPAAAKQFVTVYNDAAESQENISKSN